MSDAGSAFNQRGPFERRAAEQPDRLGEGVNVFIEVGRGRGLQALADRSHRQAHVGAELDLVVHEGDHRLVVHHGEDRFRDLTADL